MKIQNVLQFDALFKLLMGFFLIFIFFSNTNDNIENVLF
jgi:hypothetical protein